MPLPTDPTAVPAIECCKPVERVLTFAERLAQVRHAVKRIIGAPDYELYLARHQQIHPEVPPMTEKEFFLFAIERRYSKAGPRCC